MKHLEDYLKPLLDRMRRSPGWFFTILLVTIVTPAFIGTGIGTAFNIQSGIPGLVGLFVGIALFIGLFALMFHSTKRHLGHDAASIKAVFARLDQNTREVVEAALDVQLIYIEAVIEVLKSEIPEKEAALDQALAELRKQRDQFLSESRRPKPAGD